MSYSNRTGWLAAACAVVLMTGGVANAVPVMPQDLDTILPTAGDSVAGPSTDDFFAFTRNDDDSVTTNDVGDLVNEVFLNENSGIYTYVHDVQLDGLSNVSEFNTAFNVLGFNDVAGFSFSDSGETQGEGAAGGLLTDFEIEFEMDGTLDYMTQNPPDGTFATDSFDSGDSIRFFFQSDRAPTTGGQYNIIDHRTASASSFQPVPTPTAALAGVPAMLAFGLLTGRRRRKAAARHAA